jgi:hypothetical protein
MAEKISDSVGKKIVEALKMQNGGTSVVEETVDEVSDFEEINHVIDITKKDDVND